MRSLFSLLCSPPEELGALALQITSNASANAVNVNFLFSSDLYSLFYSFPRSLVLNLTSISHFYRVWFLGFLRVAEFIKVSKQKRWQFRASWVYRFGSFDCLPLLGSPWPHGPNGSQAQLNSSSKGKGRKVYPFRSRVWPRGGFYHFCCFHLGTYPARKAGNILARCLEKNGVLLV